MPDIDIDFADRSVILNKIQHRVAKLDTGKKHNTGVYVTECPHNPIDNIATIDYKSAEDRGYFKLDFLNVSIYNQVKDEEHLQRLMETEPQWQLLQHDDFVDLIFHIVRARRYTTYNKATKYRTTSSSTSDDTACQTPSCQRNLANDIRKCVGRTH